MNSRKKMGRTFSTGSNCWPAIIPRTEAAIDALAQEGGLLEGLTPDDLMQEDMFSIAWLYLQEPGDTASTRFLMFGVTNTATGVDMQMILDEETGHVLQMFAASMSSENARLSFPPAVYIGTVLLEPLDLPCTISIDESEGWGDRMRFKLTESGLERQVYLSVMLIDTSVITTWLISE